MVQVRAHVLQDHEILISELLCFASPISASSTFLLELCSFLHLILIVPRSQCELLLQRFILLASACLLRPQPLDFLLLPSGLLCDAGSALIRHLCGSSQMRVILHLSPDTV